MMTFLNLIHRFFRFQTIAAERFFETKDPTVIYGLKVDIVQDITIWMYSTVPKWWLHTV